MSSNNLPPPPSGQSLSLVSALSNPVNHELHVQAIRARDEALSSSAETYGNLCLQLAYVMIGSDRPQDMIPRLAPSELETWKQTDMQSVMRLQQDPNLWIPFGQMAGLILKNALLRPPIVQPSYVPLSLQPPVANHVKESLLYALSCQHKELRDVASTVIATSAVSSEGVQPALHIHAWPNLVPQLVQNLQQHEQTNLIEGTFSTIRKMMEDGPTEFSHEQIDALIPVLLRYLSPENPSEATKVAALQSIAACLVAGLMPNSLVAQFNDYLQALSALANQQTSPPVRKWVCRNIVTLLELRTEYIQPHLQAVAQFMLTCTADRANDSVALEACDFWLTFASLDDSVASGEMHDVIGNLIPQLIPVFLRNMVYSPEKQEDLKARNEIDEQDAADNNNVKPVFHKTNVSDAVASILFAIIT